MKCSCAMCTYRNHIKVYDKFIYFYSEESEHMLCRFNREIGLQESENSLMIFTSSVKKILKIVFLNAFGFPRI